MDKHVYEVIDWDHKDLDLLTLFDELEKYWEDPVNNDLPYIIKQN